MKIKKTIYSLIIYTLFFSGLVVCQNPADSLKLALKNAETDSAKTAIFIKLARNAAPHNKKEAIEYYKSAVKTETNQKRKATYLNAIGLYNWQLGNYEEAIIYYNKALNFFENIQDSLWLGRIYNNLGTVNWGLDNSNKALEYYQKSLKIREKISDKKGECIVLNNIGIIYRDWGLNEKAIKWHNKALEISKRTKSIDRITYSYTNLGKAFENIGNFENALKYYKLGYELLLEQKPHSRTLTFFLKHMGDIYRKTKHYDLALSYYKKSLVHAKRIQNKNRIAISEYYLGKTFIEMNMIDSADIFIRKSLKKSEKNKYLSLIKNNMFELSKIEEKRGNIKTAFRYFKKATAIKDSTITTEKIKKFNNLQIKYYMEQQSRENEILKKSNKIKELKIEKGKVVRNIFIIIIIGVLIVLAIVTKSRRTLKHLNEKLKKSKKELIKANQNKDKFFSIISHDLKSPFNGLLGISELLYSDFEELTKEEVKELIKSMRELSRNVYDLLDGLLQWAQTQMGHVEYKLEKINLYNSVDKVIALLKRSATNKNILLENKVDKEIFVLADTLALETIIRNLVTNSIKFTPPEGSVKVTAQKDSDSVTIAVIDTGIGMSKKQLDELFKIEVQHSTLGTKGEKGTGIGLILCKELVENMGGKIRAESRKGEGSKFIFSLPIPQ